MIRAATVADAHAICTIGRKFGQWLDVGYWQLLLTQPG